MVTTAGRLLVAAPGLFDPNFLRTVIVVLTHNEEGAFGLVLNRPSDSPVADHLPELASSTADPAVVFVGGPVEPEVAFALQRDEEGAGAVPGVGVVDLMDGASPPTDCRVFAGYAGWGPAQLDAELEEGSWYVVDAMVDDVFTDDPGALWAGVLRRQGGHLALIASFPLDPSLN